MQNYTKKRYAQHFFTNIIHEKFCVFLLFILSIFIKIAYCGWIIAVYALFIRFSCVMHLFLCLS